MSNFVQPEELVVQRDGDGEIVPEETEAGNLGLVSIKPMRYGDVQRFFGDGRTSDVEARELARLFDEFVIDPDLSEYAQELGYDKVNEDFVKDMKPLVPRDLLLAILDVSGVNAEVEMEQENTAQVSVGGN